MKLRAVVNVRTKKVACVLLQAALGGSVTVARMFDTENWELATSSDFRMVEGTREEWLAHADRMNKKRGRSK